MEVRSDRRYRFSLPPEDLWPLLTDVRSYRTWWPWLHDLDARAFADGERWSCVVRPPLPYSLRFGLSLHDVVAGHGAAAVIDGDIVGDARIELLPTHEGCEVRLVSRLAPSNQVLRSIAAVARPVVERGHDWVLDTGLRQFRSRALPPQ